MPPSLRFHSTAAATAANDGIASLTALTSDTWYSGKVKGDEISDYAYNYGVQKSSTGLALDSTFKSTTVYLYGTGITPKQGATTEDAMVESLTYKTASANVSLVSDTQNIQSATYYTGPKGDELSNYSYNYQVGTTTINNTSVFFYGSSAFQRSGSVTDTELSMSRSLSYKGPLDTTSLAAATITAGAPGSLANLTSDTWYYGSVKGDELSNYA